MAWQDPTLSPTQADSLPPIPMGSGMPPMSSYGPMLPSWNKETMDLLVDVEIPKSLMEEGRNKLLFVWYKKILMQLQFGNYTAADQRKFIKDLQYILFLAAQEGNEQIVFEAQLIFVSNLMMSKGRSDKPDGLRERVIWAMSIMKNIFSEEKPKRPDEAKGIFSNLPFVGGNR